MNNNFLVRVSGVIKARLHYVIHSCDKHYQEGCSAWPVFFPSINSFIQFFFHNILLTFISSFISFFHLLFLLSFFPYLIFLSSVPSHCFIFLPPFLSFTSSFFLHLIFLPSFIPFTSSFLLPSFPSYNHSSFIPFLPFLLLLSYP